MNQLMNAPSGPVRGVGLAEGELVRPVRRNRDRERDRDVAAFVRRGSGRVDPDQLRAAEGDEELTLRALVDPGDEVEREAVRPGRGRDLLRDARVERWISRAQDDKVCARPCEVGDRVLIWAQDRRAGDVVRVRPHPVRLGRRAAVLERRVRDQAGRITASEGTSSVGFLGRLAEREDGSRGVSACRLSLGRSRAQKRERSQEAQRCKKAHG